MREEPAWPLEVVQIRVGAPKGDTLAGLMRGGVQAMNRYLGGRRVSFGAGLCPTVREEYRER